jgi:hypothetical protein
MNKEVKRACCYCTQNSELDSTHMHEYACFVRNDLFD